MAAFPAPRLRRRRRGAIGTIDQRGFCLLPADRKRCLWPWVELGAAEEGDVDGGSVMAGQACGLVDDIIPVAELIERLICQAEVQIAALNRLREPGVAALNQPVQAGSEAQGVTFGE